MAISEDQIEGVLEVTGTTVDEQYNMLDAMGATVTDMKDYVSDSVSDPDRVKEAAFLTFKMAMEESRKNYDDVKEFAKDRQDELEPVYEAIREQQGINDDIQWMEGYVEDGLEGMRDRRREFEDKWGL
jgi:geranylgeranyl pyrophosphate synthase